VESTHVTRLDTNGYYALGIPFYVALIAIEYLLARRRGRRVFGFADTIGNLSAGLGEVLIGLFLGPLLIALYDFGFEHIALVRWPEGSLVPWVLAFVVSDFCYYWYHRAGHQIAAFWTIHGVHHQSEEFNVTVAMRHPWFSDSYSALFYVPLPLLGVPPTHFFVAISAISFYALTIHTRFFNRPSLFVLTTPATHVLHHATNPKYIGKNLGAMFNVWDRLFGTYVELDAADPPRLGTRTGYETHDGARSQWIFVRNLLATVRAARSLRERARVLFSRPGSAPQGFRLASAEPARNDSAIPTSVKVYAAAQFVSVVAFSSYVLWSRGALALSFSVLGGAMSLFGLSTVGGLLDGRPRAGNHERWRQIGNCLLAASMLLSAGSRAAGSALGLWSLTSLLWAARSQGRSSFASERL
jgi:alkylglycerol monooxygenase